MNKKREPRITGDVFDETKAYAKQNYVLRLYVAGMNSKSAAAIKNITKICEEHLKGRYVLEIVDLYQQTALAKGEQIIAAPTLIKKLPLPLRKFIGDFANNEKMLVGLDLVTKKSK